MVDCLRMLLCPIGPGFEYFQDEEIELVDESGIANLALKVSEALSHQGWRHTLGWRRRKAESLEFRHTLMMHASGIPFKGLLKSLAPLPTLAL